ncbi:MAG: MoaD/ThiS family protein [Dehalococcoidia bacterium]
MPTVFIPALLRPYSDGRARVTVAGVTLRQVFANLDAACPGIFARIVDTDDPTRPGGGRIRPEITVAVDGELVTVGLLQPVAESSEVFLLPAISGG